MKYILVIFLISLIGCTSQKQDVNLKSSEQDEKLEEKKSIHQREWEKNQNESNNSNNISAIINEKFSIITESADGTFNNPRFSANGDLLFFSTPNFNQIWMHNIKEGTTQLIVDLPGCGINFQISSSDDIYFRNRAKKGRSDGVYSLFRYSVSEDKLDLIYKSDQRLTPPILVNENLYFLEGDKPFHYNLNTNQRGSTFRIPFYYVAENYLFKVTNKQDTISLKGKTSKFVNCRYSQDLGYIYALTANEGIAIFDIEGNFLKLIPDASELDKLSGSSLAVYSAAKDDGQKIIESNLFIGFLNSDRRFTLTNNNSEQRFNPCWSHLENKIAYANDAGQIKTVSFNFESK